MDYNRNNNLLQTKRKLYKELQNNNNATLASYYRDNTKILSVVIRKAKRIEHDKLILNSHNTVKTTLGYYK
jgi:adenylate kinase